MKPLKSARIAVLLAIVVTLLAASPSAATSPPETTIQSGPDDGATVRKDYVQFEFTSESAVDFECELDGGGFAPCTSPYFLPGLLPGAHVFKVRAVDETGVVDPTPGVRSFSIVGLPKVSVTSGHLQYAPVEGSTTSI